MLSLYVSTMGYISYCPLIIKYTLEYLVAESEHLKIQSFVGETLRSNSTPPETIIENFLWKEDAAMLLGSEKAGKSIKAQQMLCHIVNGEPYLNRFVVNKPGPVVYIQAEGKRDEFVARLNNISMSFDKPMDDKMFLHIFKKYCPLNVPIFKQGIFDIIDKQVKVWGCDPVAICIDSVYKAMEGDLNENQDIIGFTNAIDDFISRYHSAMLLIHHDAKEWRDEKTKESLDRGDKGAYGSVFLRAYVDHILYLKMQKDKARSLTCDTTRSGNTQTEKLELILVEPSPLCFQIRGDYRVSAELILHQLRIHKQLSYKQLETITGLAMPTIKLGMSPLQKDKKVSFVDQPDGERYFSLKI